MTSLTTKRGVEALVNRGILTRKQARDLIREEAAKVAKDLIRNETKKLQTDAEIARQFPELQDQNSALFKKTGELFRSMVADDESLARSPKALLLAARAAKAELAAAGNGSGEEERLRRIAQQGGGDNARGAAFDSEADDTLTPMQRKILAALNADGGVQVSEEAYRKRAREGVRMSTRMALCRTRPANPGR